MTTEADSNLLDTQEFLSNIHISSPVVAHEPDLNPWQDSHLHSPRSQGDDHEVIQPMRVSDSSNSDPNTAQGLTAEAVRESRPLKSQARSDILDEFDPLASHEEQAAKEAWESSESHPPLPSRSLPPPGPPVDIRTDDQDEPPPPPGKSADELPARPASPLASFPSLAALARTFALPLAARQRPRSLDTATAVPSPATLSSFASQQQTPPTIVSSPLGNGGTSTSQGSKTAGTDPPQFDFQRFLDQMKLRAAEPVAKYLRSYVCTYDGRVHPIKLVS
jgi:Rab5 GDP/GTP exchange factor